MGNGIAQVFAQAGHAVVLRDVDPAALDRAMKQVDRSLGKLAEKGKIAAGDRPAILARVQPTADIALVSGADLVVEAVVERYEIKRDLFAELDRLTPAGTILASNTSSISITKLGAATRRPEKVIGMHFMNPVPLMALVEVIRGQATSEETTRAVMDLARDLGKTPVEVNDFPGFVSNRVLMPMINEAIFAVYEG